MLLTGCEQIDEDGLGEPGMLAQENQAASSFRHASRLRVKPGLKQDCM